jgi:hypothetical protein
VNLSAPIGAEDDARQFYAGVLGIPEIPKPAVLADRGGVWFESGGVQIHISVHKNFEPSPKAHPALQVHSLDAVRQRLHSAGIQVIEDDLELGWKRLYVYDSFGNRLEFAELK